jgi:alpha/beta superfamily hydrolase
MLIPSPAGRLEALLDKSAVPAPDMVAVVCHPHPLYGGTMHNKVVYHTAKALNRLGMAVLRFNFRGVGLSSGHYDEGRGEREDILAAIDYISSSYPQAKVCLAGFSFGAWVGLPVGCQDPRIAVLIGIGLPTGYSGLDFLTECRKPKLLIYGTEDEYAPLDAVEAVYAKTANPKELVLIEGANHFFEGKLDKLSNVIADFGLRIGDLNR